MHQVHGTGLHKTFVSRLIAQYFRSTQGRVFCLVPCSSVFLTGSRFLSSTYQLYSPIAVSRYYASSPSYPIVPFIPFVPFLPGYLTLICIPCVLTVDCLKKRLFSDSPRSTFYRAIRMGASK